MESGVPAVPPEPQVPDQLMILQLAEHVLLNLNLKFSKILRILTLNFSIYLVGFIYGCALAQ